ncbi:MAG TPA: TOPRIM nucleotidyl transferase/hydrolase domain-containing protein [Acidimicrobiia bacterium]
MTSHREPRGIILVEGPSDRVAIEALAVRRGRDLASEGVEVVSMGGITNLRRHLAEIGAGIRIAGMFDAGETDLVCRSLHASGRGDPVAADDLRRLGFWVCTIDLEDELVRALGPEGVLAVFEADGRLHKFRSFQAQPDKRGLPLEYQLWDYLTNWKIHYARLFVEALDLDRVPEPLDGVLTSVDAR